MDEFSLDEFSIEISANWGELSDEAERAAEQPNRGKLFIFDPILI
jgi:hypothetical protein